MKIFNFDNTYLKLGDAFFAYEQAKQFSSPKILLYNEQSAKDLQIDLKDKDVMAQALSGQISIDGAINIAQAYAGHQFGHLTMLGDGRALLLGEHVKKGQRFDVQLKGSGRTTYSRGGDGLGPLGPMLREYIISEAMYYLGIPTNRALSVVDTGDTLIRSQVEPAAVLCRVAESFIRVGTFEYAFHSHSDNERIKALLDYTITRHDKDLLDESDKYLKFLERVIDRQAKLISQWMSIGFIHGVMNTDNMSISGETFDYGPCAFMNTYHPETVFSSIDESGRYAFGNQPTIGQWNLSKLAEVLASVIHEDMGEASSKLDAISVVQDVLNTYPTQYNHYWLNTMSLKLGFEYNGKESDHELIKQWLYMLLENSADYTLSFRQFSEGKLNDLKFSGSTEFRDWYKKWLDRVGDVERAQISMCNANPVIIPRNHIVERVINQAIHNNSYEELQELLEVLKAPFETGHDKKWTEPPVDEDPTFQTFCGT